MSCGNCRGGDPAYRATWLPDNLLGGSRRDGSATITRAGEPIGGHFFGQSSFSRLAGSAPPDGEAGPPEKGPDAR